MCKYDRIKDGLKTLSSVKDEGRVMTGVKISRSETVRTEASS